MALMKKYGAKASARGGQYDVQLSSLAGKEKEFVSDLTQLVSMIEKAAPSNA